MSVEAATADLTNAFRAEPRDPAAVEPAGLLAMNRMNPQATLGSVLESRGPRRGQSATVSLWLMAVSGLVLLMACANVANLLIARALRRRREIAIRQAMGVSRGRLLAQLLTESMLLALLGGLAGVLVAHWGGALLRSVLLPNLDWSSGVFDHRVLLFAGIVALGAGLVTGLAPIRQLASTDVASALRSGGRGASLRRSRLRKTLLVVQGAVSVILLVGAGLFVRSFRNVRSLDLGFQPGNVITIGVTARVRRSIRCRRSSLPTPCASAPSPCPAWNTPAEGSRFRSPANGRSPSSCRASTPAACATCSTSLP